MSNDRIKLGVLVIGRKRPGWDQEWSAVMRTKSIATLAALGYDAVGADSPVVDDVTIEAVMDRIRNAGCRALVVLQPSLGNGQLALTVAQQWRDPVVLWATPERQDAASASSCSLVAQHLWASIFRQARHPFELVFGDPRKEEVRPPLRQAITLCSAAAAMRRAKVGLIGSQPPGYLAMAVDAIMLQRTLGAQLQQLSLPQFVERVEAVDQAAVEEDLTRVKALDLPLRDVEESELAVQSRLYLAMREVIEEERLDALTIQEWPEMPNMLGQWPYLALSRLAGEGFATAMEGDADAALTCLAASRIGAGEGFITDWLEHDGQTITLWHPGTAPLSMLAVDRGEGSARLARHFNIARPMVVDGLLPVDEPVTITRLWHCDDQYHLTAFEGRTIEPRRKLTGNSAWVEVDGGEVQEWFDRLCHAGLPHHPVMLRGHHVESLRRLARLMGIGWLQK